MKRLIITFCFLMFAGTTMAQPGSGPPPDPGEPVPLSGIEVLLVGGVLFGASKMLSRNQKHNRDA